MSFAILLAPHTQMCKKAFVFSVAFSRHTGGESEVDGDAAPGVDLRRRAERDAEASDRRLHRQRLVAGDGRRGRPAAREASGATQGGANSNCHLAPSLVSFVGKLKLTRKCKTWWDCACSDDSETDNRNSSLVCCCLEVAI